MPLYESECIKCGNVFEWYNSRATDENKKCPKCNGDSERLFSRCSSRVFRDFVTRNILPGGVPVHVKSQSQLSSLCNEHKLVHVDDPKYNPKPYTPPDPASVLGMRSTPDGDKGVDSGACRREDLLA